MPSSILEVRWAAAASIATGEETPYCRCRQRSHTEVEAEPLTELDRLKRVLMPGPGILPVE